MSEQSLLKALKAARTSIRKALRETNEFHEAHDILKAADKKATEAINSARSSVVPPHNFWGTPIRNESE
jgi:hypothetical protein